MALPVINASTPITQPAIPAITFNSWQMTMLHIDAVDVTHSKYTVVANLSRSVVNQDGTISISPTADQAVITIPDLYAAAAADGTGILAAAMAAVINAVIAQGQAQGKL